MLDNAAKAERYDVYYSVFGEVDAILYRCRNDADYTMDFLEGGVRHLTGYDADDILGNKTVSWAGIICPDDEAAVNAAVEAAIKSGTSWEISYRIKRRTGEWQWVRERGTATIDNGDLKYLQGLVVGADAEMASQFKMEKNAEDAHRDKQEVLAIAKAILKSVNKLSMLSMNARIEAARSGEAGLGFTVVASEISTLADENRAAAQQIASKFT